MPETDFHLLQNQRELFLLKKKEKEGEGGGDAGFTRNSSDMARAGFAKRAE